METNDRHWLINAGLVTSSIIAITANSFLLLIFCRRRGLRTIPNRFIINLLITNLLSSILLIPFLIVDQEFHQIKQNDNNIDNTTIIEFDNNNTMIIHEEIIDTVESNNNNNDSDNNLRVIQTNRLFGGDNDNNSDISDNNLQNTVSPTLCIAAQSTTNFVCTLSILSILLIGINQYFGVIHSLHYHFYINKARSTIFIITIWLIALLFCCLSIITNSGNTLWYFCYHDNNHNNGDNNWYFTPKTMELLRIFNQIYIFVYFIIIILAPFVAICIIYLCIYKAAHKNSERMRKSTSTNFEPQQQQNGTTTTTTNADKIESASDFLSLNDDLAPQQQQQQQQGVKHFITTLKHKLSNASMFRYREETRAAKISILVIILVLICYLPYGLILILNSTIINIKIPNIFNILSLVLLVFSNILSPFLFAYRNKRVKREILKIFGCCNSNNNNNTNICNNNNNGNKLVMPQIQLEQDGELNEPFLVPEVIVTYRLDTEKKSILKRVCDTATTNWTNYKKCSFIQVPTSCLNTDNTRGSFSSASTQISNED